MSRRRTLVCLPPPSESDLSPALRAMLAAAPPQGSQHWAVFIRTELYRVLDELPEDVYDRLEFTSGYSLPLRQDAPADDPRIFMPQDGRCAGGPVGLLDLAGWREQHAAQAAQLYDDWTQATADMPPARPLSAFATDGIDRTLARLAFEAQPRLAALAELLGERRARCRYDGPAMVVLNREQFTERARSRAVTGHSLLDVHGGWTTDPAWLGQDDLDESGSTAYHDTANARLDALSADHLLIAVQLRQH